jgi:hypothetical protein
VGQRLCEAVAYLYRAVGHPWALDAVVIRRSWGSNYDSLAALAFDLKADGVLHRRQPQFRDVGAVVGTANVLAYAGDDEVDVVVRRIAVNGGDPSEFTAGLCRELRHGGSGQPFEVEPAAALRGDD